MIGTFVVTWLIPSINTLLPHRPSAQHRQFFTGRYANLRERSSILEVAIAIGGVARHCRFGDDAPLQRGREWLRGLSEDARSLLLVQLGEALDDLRALAKGALAVPAVASQAIRIFFEKADDLAAIIELGKNDEDALDWDLDLSSEEHTAIMEEARKLLPQWLAVPDCGLSPHLAAILALDEKVWWAPLYLVQPEQAAT